MPINPTPDQSGASRRNLRGKEGPKTESGKARSAANGRMNRGIKTAKSRAKVINALHGLNDSSLYGAAGCLHCQLQCHWKSFTATTPHSELPLGCFERVLLSQPSRCFYHLEGLCMLGCHRDLTPERAPQCVVEIGFLSKFANPSSTKRVDTSRKELLFRRRTIRLISEARLYLAQIRRQGSENVVPHPRMIRVLRDLKYAINHCKPCKFTPWGTPQDWDEMFGAID